jgi:hypothetical protein
MSKHFNVSASRSLSSGTSCEPVCSLIPGINGDIQVVHNVRANVMLSARIAIPGINGDIQVVHSRSGQTVIDVQSVHFDVTGQVRHDHSTIRLTYDAVCELRELLDQIAEPMEPRQPALWSDAIFSRPVHTQRTRGKRRATA